MAEAILKTVIKSNPVGRWYLEIRDPEDENNTEICLDINEYAEKIETMGAEYGGEVKVVWSSEENVTQEQINEVRNDMKEFEKKMNDEKEQSGEAPSHNMDGSPTF